MHGFNVYENIPELTARFATQNEDNSDGAFIMIKSLVRDWIYRKVVYIPTKEFNGWTCVKCNLNTRERVVHSQEVCKFIKKGDSQECNCTLFKPNSTEQTTRVLCTGCFMTQWTTAYWRGVSSLAMVYKTLFKNKDKNSKAAIQPTSVINFDTLNVCSLECPECNGGLCPYGVTIESFTTYNDAPNIVSDSSNNGNSGALQILGPEITVGTPESEGAQHAGHYYDQRLQHVHQFSPEPSESHTGQDNDVLILPPQVAKDLGLNLHGYDTTTLPNEQQSPMDGGEMLQREMDNLISRLQSGEMNQEFGASFIDNTPENGQIITESNLNERLARVQSFIRTASMEIRNMASSLTDTGARSSVRVFMYSVMKDFFDDMSDMEGRSIRETNSTYITGITSLIEDTPQQQQHHHQLQLPATPQQQTPNPAKKQRACKQCGELGHYQKQHLKNESGIASKKVVPRITKP